jgi:hypothetical protein
MTRMFTLVVFGAILASIGQGAAYAQKHKPLPTPMPESKIPGTGSNHRLILKDGSYQIVRKYEIVGDRVRYISVERGGDWEELPTNLIDWDATQKWERDHAAAANDDISGDEATKEAREIDKEEAEARAEERARTPEVAKGLNLPDQDTIYALDYFEGTPELVELKPNELAMDAKSHHGLNTLNPLAASRAAIELPGAHAKVHLHVNEPAIYLSLEVTDDTASVVSHAMTVNTSGAKEAANRKHGAHSTQSGFVIVRVDERKEVRVVGSLKIGHDGTVSQDEDVVPVKTEVLPGKHWVKIVPTQTLTIGEYALVEIISPSEINQTVWDFRVDPRLGDNRGSLGPLIKETSNQ